MQQSIIFIALVSLPIVQIDFALCHELDTFEIHGVEIRFPVLKYLSFLALLLSGESITVRFNHISDLDRIQILNFKLQNSKLETQERR